MPLLRIEYVFVMHQKSSHYALKTVQLYLCYASKINSLRFENVLITLLRRFQYNFTTVLLPFENGLIMP